VSTLWTSQYHRAIAAEEQQIYDHLLFWVEQESPNQIIERFQSLFLSSARYSDTRIAAALDHVISSKAAAEEFRFVLNRCCHILINRWQSRSTQTAIPELINLFEQVATAPTDGKLCSRSARRLRELLKLFRGTEQYLTLKRLAQVCHQSSENNIRSSDRSLGSLIRRYPYLYEHCLLSEDSMEEQQQTIKQIQSDIWRKFEIDLSQYLTYRLRQSQAINSSSSGKRILRSVPNPTLLNDVELNQAIQHYLGKVDGNYTHKDLAHLFLAHSTQMVSYASFKDDLYQYIISAVGQEYGRHKFNRQLYDQLKSALPESNSQPLNDFLMVRTCSQLLNFLVVDSPHQPNHFIFVDLLTNLGPVLTIGLLLRIVLICRKMKPHLERRFSILFNHYESSSWEMVQWLVTALEHLNVAFSTNFGSVNLSFIPAKDPIPKLLP
jgi:hypothetical protein